MAKKSKNSGEKTQAKKASAPAPEIKDEKPRFGGLFIVVFIVIALLGLSIFLTLSNAKDGSIETSSVAAATNGIEPAGDADAETAASPEEAPADEPSFELPPPAEAEPAQQVEQPQETMNIPDPTLPRVLGNPNAPVKIEEHSSFTCSHCGDFHRNVFEKLKADYIDTGKAYLVFDDFPLNTPAMHASLVARCLSDDRYFNFVTLLFNTQQEWAYNDGYLTYLKQNAMLAGLSEERYKECIQNEAVQKSIAENMQKAQTEHDIKSTPTFVLNDSTVISGAQSYEAFQKAIDEELAKTGG